MQLPTETNLRSIRVVAYLNGTFVGIPYDMRPGHSPRDIEARWRDEWVYLGSPGWYAMSAAEKAIAVAFMRPFLAAVAWYEGTWIDVAAIRAESIDAGEMAA